MPRKRRVRADTPVRQRIALTRTLGIDVDCDMLVVAHWLSNQPEIKVDEFPNNPTGHKALVERAAAFRPELIGSNPPGLTRWRLTMRCPVLACPSP